MKKGGGNCSAVMLAEVRGVLTHLLTMLECGGVRVAEADEICYRPPLEAGSDAAWFPASVSTFESREENLAVYRLIAAQHAGRREFGSYEFDLDRFADAFGEPELARRLFLVFESLRVDAALARTYRGLARDLRWLSLQEGLKGRRALVGTVEHLKAAVADSQPNCLPLIEHWIGQLDRSHASTSTSAQATVSIYLALKEAAHWSMTIDGDIIVYQNKEGGELERLAAAGGNGTRLQLDVPPELAGSTLAVERGADGDQSATEESSVKLADLSLEALLELLRSLLQKANGSTGKATSRSGAGIFLDAMQGGPYQESKTDLQGNAAPSVGLRAARGRRDSEAFVYDEWDYEIDGYRAMWCTLSETPLPGKDDSFFSDTVKRYSKLLAEVRLQFQQIKPEGYRTVKRLEQGEDFDLSALVDARADRRAGHSPSQKLYVARRPEVRDVATLFLLDMSASTDEQVGTDENCRSRRIIDISKEALVIMSEALEQIGDGYAIYGFSGHGRHQVEFYVIKRFNEALSPAVKGRIGAIEPRRSTRMGTALRHAIERMRTLPARSKHMILLSDGFPQDVDYGSDRRSNTYGIQDTMKALLEAAHEGINPFCVTVDKAGHDYLKEMCSPARYLVIEDVESLPEQLPKIYQRFIYS